MSFNLSDDCTLAFHEMGGDGSDRRLRGLAPRADGGERSIVMFLFCMPQPRRVVSEVEITTTVDSGWLRINIPEVNCSDIL